MNTLDSKENPRTARFTNSAFGESWNKNKSPKNYGRVSTTAKNGKGPRG